MSSVSSDVSVPSVTVYDPLGASGFQIFTNGSVYRAAPAPAADGEAQAFNMDPLGNTIVTTLAASPLRVQGAAADNAPTFGNPVWVGSVYNAVAPAYASGDVAALQSDVNGKLIVTDPLINAKLNNDFGANVGALRTAAQLGNAAGSAAFGAGVTGAQVLRVVLPTDQSIIPVDVQSSVLPTGAATEATLAAINGKLVDDFGASAAALRVAALLGNAAGIAAFGAGVTGAQVLRVVLPTDQTAIPAAQSGAWSVDVASSALPTGAATEATLAAINGKLVDDFGVATAALRTAAQIGNVAGAAAFGAGVTGAQVLRVVLPTDQTAIPAAQSGAWSVSVSSSALPTGAATEATLASIDGKLVDNFGAVAGALRTAAIPGNAAGIADFNAGNVSAQTPRVVLASDQPAVSVRASTPTATTVKQAAITVGTTAVRLTTDAAAPSATRRRVRFMPDQASTGRFFYGSSSVTSSGATRGCEIFPAQTEEFIDDAGDYYIISDTAGQTVYVVEQE